MLHFMQNKLNFIKVQLNLKVCKRFFLCSRADQEYMYTHIYMIYKSMTAHKL